MVYQINVLYRNFEYLTELSLYYDIKAIEDAIYFITKALSRGTIDCDTFLRYTRRLARQQVKNFAMIRKFYHHLSERFHFWKKSK